MNTVLKQPPAIMPAMSERFTAHGRAAINLLGRGPVLSRTGNLWLDGWLQRGCVAHSALTEQYQRVWIERKSSRANARGD
jgi:hypothetical protein